jgi:phage I-like protein
MQSLQEKVNDEKIQSIISQALADHKMTPAMSEQLQADYKGRPDALKALVDTMPAQTTINSQLTATIPAEIAGKTYKELYDEGKLEMVKQNYPDHYAAIRKTYLGE